MTLYTERDLNRSTSKESKNLTIRLSLEQMVRASKTLLNAFEHLPGLLMSRKDRILVFLFFFFLHLFEEARSENRDGERISVKEARACLPRNATFPSAEGGKIYVALSFLSVRLRRFPFPSRRFSFLLAKRQADVCTHALRRRGINKKTAAGKEGPTMPP